MNKLMYFINIRWLLLSLIVVCIDSITKYWVIVNCVYGKSIYILSFVNCYYVHNFGVAFGLLSYFGVKYNVFVSSIIVLVILILVYLLCCLDIGCSYWLKIGYAIIIGGAFGNLLNRMYYGMVIDFIDFHVGNWHWPTFNIADLSIFLGVVITLYNNKL